jgi:hypothetical protein
MFFLNFHLLSEGGNDESNLCFLSLLCDLWSIALINAGHAPAQPSNPKENYMSEYSSANKDSRQPITNELTESIKEKEVRSLLRTDPEIIPKNLIGMGFTYRHDWGERHGNWKLTLNWNAISCHSRVFVSASEFGGGNQCGLTGGARYTVHNVSPQNGSVTVWVNIEWDSDIQLHLDYLVINP